MSNGVSVRGSLSDGWGLYKENAVFMSVSSVIIFLVIVVLSLIPFLNMLQVIWQIPVSAGLIYVIQDKAQGSSSSYGRLFDGVRLKFIPLAISSILILVFGGLIPMGVAGLILGLAGIQLGPNMVVIAVLLITGFIMMLINGWYILTFFYIVGEDMGFWSAMEASRKAMSESSLTSIAMVALVFLLMLGGIALLFIGLFVTLPLALCVLNSAYEQASGAGRVTEKAT